jgi:hypothetical protein
MIAEDFSLVDALFDLLKILGLPSYASFAKVGPTTNLATEAPRRSPDLQNRLGP